jgi:hypothetical protein
VWVQGRDQTVARILNCFKVTWGNIAAHTGYRKIPDHLQPFPAMI